MSESDGPRTLYANSDHSRFFWIPDDHACEKGTLLLRSLTGSKREVTADEASKWEIPEGQAKELSKLEVQKLTRAAGSLLSAGASVFSQVAKAQREGKVGTVKDIDKSKGAEGIAQALGVTPEELVSDPQKALEGLKSTIEGIGDTLKKSASENPADSEEVKARMQILAAAVKKATGDDTIGDDLEDLPGKLMEFLSNPELAGRVRKMSEELRQTAEEIRNATNVKGES